MSSAAIVPLGLLGLSVGGGYISPDYLGWQPEERPLTYKDLRAVIATFYVLAELSNWALGDSLIEMRRLYGEVAMTQAVAEIDMNPETARNAIWVCESYAPDERVWGASWTAHKLCARHRARRADLLKLTVDDNLSTRQLADLLNHGNHPPPQPPEPAAPPTPPPLYPDPVTRVTVVVSRCPKCGYENHERMDE